MNDTLHRTDTLNPRKPVTCGAQKQHWIEFCLLDEQGDPLANMPYKVVNDATREGCASEYIGKSDAQGLIRIEGLHPLPITVFLDADPLAEQLQKRRLRAERPEPPRPGLGERIPLYGPQRPGFSPIEQQAREQGHAYHYLRIGQLCNRLPDFEPALSSPEQLPGFHFPDPEFNGFTIDGNQLSRRHVLEVCPLRAWSLLLHHEQEYSLANAYNLALMSMLAYSIIDEGQLGSVEDFFLQQCLDLSRTPRVLDSGKLLPCLVNDVPFNERYSDARMLDTTKADPPEGDTQFFYATSASQLVVSWRGTEITGFADLATDLTFRPVEPQVQAGCDTKSPCGELATEGRVHLGFRNGFEVARRIYDDILTKNISDGVVGKELFICGHSLGGALGLIHAAALKSKNPMLYTYGMPRTFTLKAVLGLSEVRHFRHVNDIDTIPDVPPEADLDNYLYDVYGPLGSILGFVWSLGQLTVSSVFNRGDPYCHHGEVAMFFQTLQHIQQRGSSYPAYRNKDGLGAPYYNTISRRLPEKAKLYLVPSLGEFQGQEVEQAQRDFTTSLSTESRSRFFPPNGNPKKGRLLGIGDHMMSQYHPYLYEQLLEAINPSREPMLALKAQRQRFEQQMKDNHANLPEQEYSRNRLFLELQSLLGQSLGVTREIDGGAEALRRFNAVADPKASHAKTYG